MSKLPGIPGNRLLWSFTLISSLLFPPARVLAQCVGLPAVTSLGSNKFPAGICAPVNANVTYNVSFTSPVPAGTLEVVYDWGDGSAPEAISLTTGSKTYQAAHTHSFPAESDCEYLVTIAVRYNGTICTNTRQVQKVASWRTDNFNGGDIDLYSPVTETEEHLVCEGEPVDVIFQDGSSWNCSSLYTKQPMGLIESPNIENRWQQIVYNTPVSGSKIPNIQVDGVPVTGPGGADIVAGYQDPRGVYYMTSPVYVDDPRKRSALQVTAPGGFGDGYPKAGDEFAIKLRYWNFCNPYDDPDIPGPPADAVNGDHAPIESKATIKIVAPPAAPSATDRTVCYGTAPPAFSVSGVPAGNQINWYKNIPGPDRPGGLIATGKTLKVTSHPDWKDNTTPGVLKVWVSHHAKAAGALNCESPKTPVSRTIREDLPVPDPETPVPAEVCNNSTVTITLPPPATEPTGGSTQYTWSGSEGVSFTSGTASSATFSVHVEDFGTALFADRTITVNRQYTTSPDCPSSKVFTFRVYRQAAGGTLSGGGDICQTTPADPITLSGHTGEIARWEIKKDDGVYTLYTGAGSGTSISPGMLDPGRYWFRAAVDNGVCSEAFSNEETMAVSVQPPVAHAGEDQFICTSLSSASLNASDPSPGTGAWSYVSSVPAALPAPAFTTHVHDPKTSISVAPEHAGAYTLRWTVTNGSCISTDDVVVDFGTDPSEPHAGEDKEVCGPVTSLEGNIPEKGLGQWTVVSGPGGCSGNACPVAIIKPASPASSVELKGPSFTYGTYTFRWSISSGGNNCFLKSDDVTIRFDEPTLAYAEDIQNICLDADNLAPIALTGTVEGASVHAAWVNVSGAGAVTESTISGAATRTVEAAYKPAPDDYTNGLPIEVKLVSEPDAASACPVMAQVIHIMVDRKPVAHAGSDIANICDDAVELHAEPPLYNATGIWTTSTAGVTFSDPQDPHAMAENLPAAPSQTTATWTLTSASGLCTSEPSSITLTRVALPPATDLAVTECEVSDATTSVVLTDYESAVTSLLPEDRTIEWYAGAAPPTGVPVADPEEARPDIANGQVYVARIRDAHTACTSDARVTISVRPLPEVMNGLITRCEDTPGGNIASGIDLGEAACKDAVTPEENVAVTWYNSLADAQHDASRITQPILVENSKEVYARVTYQDTPACFTTTRLNIVVNSRPAITTIYGRESACQGDPSADPDDLHVETYQVTPIAGATYTWQVPGDADTQFKVFGGGGEDDFYLLLQFPNVYTGKINVRAELNGCSGPVVEKKIAVGAAPARPVINGSSIVCEYNSGVAFSVSPNNYPASTYNWEIRRASDNTAGGAYIIEGQSTGNILASFLEEDVILSVRENNAVCASPVAAKVVKVTRPPKASLDIEKEISCFLGHDGAIRTTATGGTIPYKEYTLLQTGAVDTDNDGVFKNLGPGSYSVRVKDANGCEATSNMQVLVPPAQVLITDVTVPADANGYNTSCRDAGDGAVTAFFSGGNDTAAYTLSLTKAGDTDAVQLQGYDSVTFTGLSPGTYTLAAQDVNGCVSQPSVAYIVNPPPLFAGQIGADQRICSGEDPAPIEELAAAYGGVGNYVYEWQASAGGDVHDDAAWITIAGATGVSYDPPVLTTTNPEGEQRHYRRLVRSISQLHGAPQHCEAKGGTEKVTITIHPTPEVSFVPNAGEVCYGEPLSIMLDLTVGTAPIEYYYANSTQEFAKRQGGKNTVIAVSDFREDDTYTLLGVTDANGCAVAQLPAPVSARVLSVTPDFSIDGPDALCDGGEFTFSWNVEADVDYRWEWTDGTVDEFRAGDLPPGAQRITHRFPKGSSHDATVYPVRLFVKSPVCPEKFISRPVTVYPALVLNIAVDDTIICSGETITFRDNSSGIDRGTWYYHEPGTAQRLGETAGAMATASFTPANMTEKNPLVYEMVYEAENNEGCSAVYKQQVTVYRGNQADFTVGDIPPFKGETSDVTFTNKCQAIDTEDFAYTWDFGEHGVLAADNGKVYDVQYFSAGKKEVTLTVANIQAQQAGEYCQSKVTREVYIPVYALDASFRASPTAACFPVDITIDNTSAGADTFLWKVYDTAGLVTTSNLRNPAFRMTHPGTYDIYLTASYSATGRTDEATFRGIKVLDVPQAAFVLRSDLIYVPDTELQVFNFSSGADLYEWRFGDGGTAAGFEPAYTYQTAGTYTVELLAGIDHGDQDRDGDGMTDGVLVCYDSARQEVVAQTGGDIVIPNAFTPSTAGPSGGRSSRGSFNDVFLPKVKGVTAYTLQLFNRWGTLIFESHDPDTGWDGYDRDGRLMPAGVYVYKIVLTLSNGERTTRVGDVTLIR